MQKLLNKIMCGNCIEVLSKAAQGSVNMWDWSRFEEPYHRWAGMLWSYRNANSISLLRSTPYHPDRNRLCVCFCLALILQSKLPPGSAYVQEQFTSTSAEYTPKRIAHRGRSWCTYSQPKLNLQLLDEHTLDQSQRRFPKTQQTMLCNSIIYTNLGYRAY